MILPCRIMNYHYTIMSIFRHIAFKKSFSALPMNKALCNCLQLLRKDTLVEAFNRP
jgi:hypothetical protein